MEHIYHERNYQQLCSLSDGSQEEQDHQFLLTTTPNQHKEYLAS